MFAGLFRHDRHDRTHHPVTAAALSAALAPCHRPDREGLWQSGEALLLAQRTFNAAASRDERLPLQCPHAGTVLAFWGRLDHRDGLAGKLGLNATRTLDSELALAAWQRWDARLTDHIQGDFAIAILEPRARRVFLLRDAMGCKPLYYRHDAAGLAFASSVPGLLALGLPRPDADQRWMAEYLLGISMSRERTGFVGILKLPPGHALDWRAGESPAPRRWHDWRDDSPDAGTCDPQRVAEYRAVLEEAIHCRIASDYPLGCENSGGLDSATITSHVARLLGDQSGNLHTFGTALTRTEADHLMEVSLAAQIKHNHICTSPAIIEPLSSATIARSLRVLGYPEEHIIGSMLTPFYEEASRHGVRTLLSGFGGDEVVTSKAQHVPFEMLDRGHHQALSTMLPGNALMRQLRAARMRLRPRRPPEAFNPTLLQGCEQRWPLQPLREEVIAAHDLKTAYFETARHDAGYRRSNDFLINHVLQQGYLAQRFESGTLIAASWGLEYRWPLCDTRLIQQYLSTPSVEKRGPAGLGRYLHRRAVSGLVPDRVAWKANKDVGNVALVKALIRRRATSLRADLMAALEEMPSAVAELVDKQRMEVVAGQVSGDSSIQSWLITENSLLALRWLSAWLRTAPEHPGFRWAE